MWYRKAAAGVRRQRVDTCPMPALQLPEQRNAFLRSANEAAHRSSGHFGTHCGALCQTEYAIVPLPDALAGTE
jgi:hypothetical protein